MDSTQSHEKLSDPTESPSLSTPLDRPTSKIEELLAKLGAARTDSEDAARQFHSILTEAGYEMTKMVKAPALEGLGVIVQRRK